MTFLHKIQKAFMALMAEGNKEAKEEVTHSILEMRTFQEQADCQMRMSSQIWQDGRKQASTIRQKSKIQTY